MAESDPWKNRKSVRICACIDMLFAFLVLSAYVLRATMENFVDEADLKLPRGFFRPGEKPAVTIALWVAAFAINIVQFVLAYLLLTAAKKGSNESEIGAQLSRSKYWLIIANIIFVMLISKFIFFVFFDKGNNSIVKVSMLILCICELLFKAYAMYFVKEYLDDLKTYFNSKLPKVVGKRLSDTRTSV